MVRGPVLALVSCDPEVLEVVVAAVAVAVAGIAMEGEQPGGDPPTQVA
jgi:hypothetical protein